MNIFWTLSKWFFKIISLLIFLGVLLVGFSFAERGELSRRIVGNIAKNLSGNLDISNYERDLIAIEADQRTVIKDNVVGDVYANKVSLNRNVSVTGAIFAEEEVEVNGEIYGDVLGADIMIGELGLVRGNVGNDESQVDVAGTIQGDLKGKQVILRKNAVVHGNVYSINDTIVITPGADVRGHIIAAENKPLTIIKGEAYEENFKDNIERANDNKDVVYVNERHGEYTNKVLAWIPMLIGLISLILLAQTFLKSDADQALSNMINSPWKSFWKGITTLLLSFPVLFLLSVSIIGIPVAVALGVALLTASLVGVSGFATWVGERVGTSFGITKESYLKEALLGTILLSHIIWVPVFGWVATSAILTIGLGSVSIFWWPRFKETWKEWRAKRKV